MYNPYAAVGWASRGVGQILVTALVTAVLSGCTGPDEDDYELREDCDEPHRFCDGVCIDTNADPDHCGECGNGCEAGEVCEDGSCTVGCPSGQQLCGDGCYNVETSFEHCGSCSDSCQPGEVCEAGSCVTSCGEGLENCSGGCIDTAVDPNHCGGCGVECELGEVCLAGSCESSCGGGQTACGGICRDLGSDPDHCGACDEACPPSFSCLEGTCHAIDDYPTVLGGLRLWLRPDRQLASDAGEVTAWSDAAGGGETAVPTEGARAPVVVQEALGGESVVRFDGQGDSLRVDDFSYPAQQFTHTFVFVPAIQVDAHTEEAMTLYHGDETAANTRVQMTLNEDDNGRLGIYTFTQGELTDRLETNTDQWYRGHPYVVTFQYDGDEMAVYVDGELEESESFAGQLQWQEAFEFGSGAGGEHFHGDLAEMLVFDRALDGGELESLHTYLFNRYHLFFEGAPWVEDHAGEAREFIEEYELSEAQFDNDGFETIAAAHDCSDHLAEGRDRNGVYSIQPSGDSSPQVVFCEMTADGGAWTQIAHVRRDSSAPYPGRQPGGIHPDELGHSIDADGMQFAEIGLTHNGLGEEEFARFELQQPVEWDSSHQDLRFELEDGTLAIFSLSADESPGCGDIPAVCIGSDNDNCTDQSRDTTWGSVSSGTGCCVALDGETSTTCGGWGDGPDAGDRTWSAEGGRLFLR